MKELIKIGDEIVGAVLTTPTGALALRARKGVVLATGGIGWSEELRDRFLPENTRRYSLAPDTNTGDGILAGEHVVGEIDSKLYSPALWMPSSVMKQPDGHLSVFPHIMLDRAKPGLLAVGCNGRRFVNEANSYHDFVQAMLRSNSVAVQCAVFSVCDRSFISDFGLWPRSSGNARPRAVSLMPAICSKAGRWRTLPRRLAWTAKRWRKRSSATTATPKPGSTKSSAAERANSTASTAIRPTSPIHACGRSGPGPITRSRSGPRTWRAVSGLRTDSGSGPAIERRAAQGTICGRNRCRLDLQGNLSRTGDDDRTCHGFRLAGGHGCRRCLDDYNTDAIEPCERGSNMLDCKRREADRADEKPDHRDNRRIRVSPDTLRHHFWRPSCRVKS